MGSMMMLAFVLIGLWVVAVLFFKVASFLVHVLLLIGAILVIMALVRRFSGSSKEAPPPVP